MNAFCLPGSQVAFTHFNCLLSLLQLSGKPKADISLTWQIIIIPILLMRKLRLREVNNMLKVIGWEGQKPAFFHQRLAPCLQLNHRQRGWNTIAISFQTILMGLHLILFPGTFKYISGFESQILWTGTGMEGLVLSCQGGFAQALIGCKKPLL